MSGGKQETSVSGFKPAMNVVKDTLIPGAQGYINQYGGGEGLFEGSQLAGQDPLVTQAQDMQLGLIPQLQGQFGNVTDTLEGFLDYDPNSAQNTASRQALSNNVNAIFNESIRPGIEDRGTFAGQFGGPQQNIALGAATAPLSRAIADSEVGLMNADRERAFRAMQGAPSILSSQLMPSQIMGDIGGQRTQRGQLELADMIQEFEAPRRNAFQSQLEAQGLINPLTGMGSTSSAPGANPLQGALGGAAAGSAFGPVGAAVGGGLGALSSLL